MKKFTIIMLTLFICAAGFTACSTDDDVGNRDLTGDTCNPETDDNFCSDNTTQMWCSQDGVWAETHCPGGCEGSGDNLVCKQDGGDTGDTGDTGNTGNTGNTGDSGATYETCEELLACTGACDENDQECFDDCGANASTQAINDYNALAECVQANCAEDNSLDCYIENCPEEAAACGFKGGDESYPSPYGTLSLNGSLNYVITEADAEVDQSMVVMSAFATGNMGSSGSIDPNAEMIYSMLQYSEDSQGNTYIVQQQGANNQEQAPVNPVAMLQIPEENFGTGNGIPLGLTEDDKAIFFVVDVDFNANSISCMHSFAVGSFDITDAVGQPGNAGSFSFNGSNIEIYSPANATPYGGDISEQLDLDACPVQ